MKRDPKSLHLWLGILLKICIGLLPLRTLGAGDRQVNNARNHMIIKRSKRHCHESKIVRCVDKVVGHKRSKYKLHLNAPTYDSILFATIPRSF